MRSLYSVSACSLAAAVALAADQEYCRALVMSGGASNGAWEAGLVWGLANSGNEEDFYYDVVTGVSAGAINAAGMAGYARDEVKAAAQFLSDTWSGLTNPKIWKLYDGEGLIKGCLKEHGCLDDSPLVALIDGLLKGFPQGFKKRVTVASANVGTGQYETFTQGNTSWEDFHYAAVASGSIPGAFPPMHYDGMVLMDGGTIWDVNLPSAVKQCNEMGVTDPSKIIIDIAVCGPGHDRSFDPKKDAAINWLDSFQLHRSYHSLNSLQWQQRAYPDLNYRYMFYEEHPATGPWLLDFRNSTTYLLQEQGRQDAQEILQLGEGTAFQAMRDWMDDERAMEAKYGDFMSYLRTFLPSFDQ